MKRFLSLTLVAIMLLSTLMLSSCDFIDNAKGFIGGLFGNGDDESTKITEAEWDAMFQITNFTIYAQVEGIEMYVAVADSLVQYELTLGEYSEKYFADVSKGLVIAEYQSSWVGEENGSALTETGKVTLGAFGWLDGIEYSDLTYNQGIGAYEAKDESTFYEFRFKDGVLVFIGMKPVDSSVNGVQKVTNIGTTTVTLPEYTPYEDIVDDSSRYTVTEEQWNAQTNTYNYTLLGVTEGFTATIKCAENGAQQISDSVNLNVAFVNGIVYDITLNEETGEYGAKESPDMILEDFALDQMVTGTKLNYYTFIYNADLHRYEIDTFVNGYRCEIFVYFEDGKLIQIDVIEYYEEYNGQFELSAYIQNIGETVVELPEYEKDTTVTEEDWNAIFDCNNYSMEIYMESSGTIVAVAEHAYIKSMNNASLLHLDNENDEDIYKLKTDDGIYSITLKEDGLYYGSLTSATFENSIRGALTIEGISDAMDYSEFYYDETLKAYVRYVSVDETNYTIVVYFIDGTISAIEVVIEQADGSGGADMYIDIYDIGQTYFEIPEYTIVE